jgi:uncharacterized membrane protein YhaH (DUF805 family)
MSTHDPHSAPNSSATSEQPYQQGYGGQPQGGYGQPSGYNNQYAPQPTGTQPGVPVGFVEAIKRFYAKYAQFSGRASRSEYWWVALYMAIIYIPLSILSSTAGTNSLGEPNGFGILLSILLGLFALGHIVPSIAIGVRRLHDVNMSGWFYLLSLIPFVGGLIMLVFMVLPPKPEGARFDR